MVLRHTSISLSVLFVMLLLPLILYRTDPGARILRQYGPTIMAAAERHNPLEGVSDEAFATWMVRLLLIEMGGEDWLSNPLLSELWQPIWLRVQALENDLLGGNTSVGLAQVRPETIQQLREGSITHGGRVINHSARPVFTAAGGGPYRTSSQRLLDPVVAIEYLAANLEMGARVARAWGYEPTLEDLARWHNTGVGRWTPRNGATWERAWRQGDRYVERVVRMRSPAWDPREGFSKAVVSRWPWLAERDNE